MNAWNLILIVIIVDLFLYYGAIGLGESPDIGDRTFGEWVNITTEQANELGPTGLVTTDINPVSQLVSGLENFFLNLLSPIAGFLALALNIVSMPFVLGDIMHLTGMAKVIPSVLFGVGLTIGVGKLMTGRSGQ